MSSPTSLPLPPNSFRGRYPPPHSSSGYPSVSCSSPDTGSLTGAAPIQRPKLTTTVWEDEGTLCYQVDAKNICVARRQDNDMVNGTKLLNVVGMSRGKRDGILKNEKGRVVVKVGAMHLKGVWITFSRGKDLATKFKILDLLYPLFTDDPSMFLCTSSPANNNSGVNNDSTTSTSSNNSNGVPVTSDTASVETAQSSSTVKSLVHHHHTSNVPPLMAYKTDSYNMLPSWMDQRSYQQSLPSINNNNNNDSNGKFVHYFDDDYYP
ncbi:transcription regulator HTH, apses-type DNA-binding domain-containing protein [Circinella umbellata]|nr:transcription regulator HTH, apses-type DNA-binding domain-containing protein [Circinella umbellata]